MSKSALLNPRGGVPLEQSDEARVRVLTQGEWFSKPGKMLPDAAVAGYQRIVYPGINSSRFRTNIIVLPIGQGAPVHDSKLQHVITVLRGAVEFALDEGRYRINELEQIYLPPGVFYEYRNVVLQDSWFLNVTCPVGEWPAEMTRGEPTGRYTGKDAPR